MDKHIKKIVEEIENNKNNYKSFNSFNYYNSFIALDIYLKKKFKGIFAKKNKKEALKYMDVILKYATQANNEWVYDTYFVNQEGFKEAFTKNIKYFPFKDNFPELINLLSISREETIFSKELIDEITFNHFRMNDIVRFIPDDLIHYFIDKCIDNNIDFSQIIYDLLEKDKNYVVSKIDQIIPICSDLFLLRNLIKDENSIRIINDYLNSDINHITDAIVVKQDKDINKNFQELIKLIVLDICKNENVTSFSDIKYLGCGAFSSVFRIGEKILKIGDPRIKNKIPDNPYILRPLFRRQIDYDESSVFIEVCENCDTSIIPSYEELYDLYKKVRNIGLIWVDVHDSNVGYLKKDNVIYWRDEIEPSSENLTMEEKEHDEILKKGELVIIDSDLIFKETDKITEVYVRCTPYEEKFQLELKEVLDYLSSMGNILDDNTIDYINKKGFRPEYIKDIINNKGIINPLNLKINEINNIR